MSNKVESDQNIEDIYLNYGHGLHDEFDWLLLVCTAVLFYAVVRLNEIYPEDRGCRSS